MISQQNIDAVKNRIVDFLHPEKIILFGSYFNDTANEDSDLDILVIHKTNIIGLIQSVCFKSEGEFVVYA